jgi:hypothetical protein
MVVMKANQKIINVLAKKEKLLNWERNLFKMETQSRRRLE